VLGEDVEDDDGPVEHLAPDALLEGALLRGVRSSSKMTESAPCSSASARARRSSPHRRASPGRGAPGAASPVRRPPARRCRRAARARRATRRPPRRAAREPHPDDDGPLDRTDDVDALAGGVVADDVALGATAVRAPHQPPERLTVRGGAVAMRPSRLRPVLRPVASSGPRPVIGRRDPAVGGERGDRREPSGRRRPSTSVISAGPLELELPSRSRTVRTPPGRWTATSSSTSPRRAASRPPRRHRSRRRRSRPRRARARAGRRSPVRDASTKPTLTPSANAGWDCRSRPSDSSGASVDVLDGTTACGFPIETTSKASGTSSRCQRLPMSGRAQDGLEAGREGSRSARPMPDGRSERRTRRVTHVMRTGRGPASETTVTSLHVGATRPCSSATRATTRTPFPHISARVPSALRWSITTSPEPSAAGATRIAPSAPKPRRRSGGSHSARASSSESCGSRRGRRAPRRCCRPRAR
jgi:hypothetical protein